MTKSRLIAAGIAMLAAGTIAYGAGNYENYPIVGQPAFCTATVTGAGAPFGGATGQGQGTTGSICAQTVPQGPTGTTGEELANVDLNSGNGNGPTQSVNVPLSLLGGLNNRINRLVGGDFGTNLWQRGTTPVSASTSETAALMTADRWWVQGPTSGATQITVSKQVGATDSMPSSGFYASLRVARPSAQTGTGIICIGQTLDKQAAAELLGQNGVLSFYANTGANFSPTNGNITAQIGYFTAADANSAQSAVGAAGTNSLTSALSIAGQSGGIAGFAEATAGTSTGFPGGSVTGGIVTIPTAAAGTWTRYSVYGSIPSANASGTAITGVVIGLCWTPVGTAGTNDWIEFTGMQLQAQTSAVSNSMPAGIVSPTGFERRAPEIEAGLQFYYSYVINEVASTSAHWHGTGYASTTTNANEFVQFPVPMRQTPAAAYTTGFAATTGAGTAETCTGLATVTNTLSPNTAGVACTTSGITGGQPSQLIDNTGTGVISYSAEP